jgi:hypothetical protein
MGLDKALKDPDNKEKLIRSLELAKPADTYGTGKGLQATDSQSGQLIDQLIAQVKDGKLAASQMPVAAAYHEEIEAARRGKETMYPTVEGGYQPASIAQGLTKDTGKEPGKETRDTIRTTMAKYFGYSSWNKLEGDAPPRLAQAVVKAVGYWEKGGMSPDVAMEKALMEDPFMFGEMVKKQFPGAVEEPGGSGNWFVTDESGIKRPVRMRFE